MSGPSVRSAAGRVPSFRSLVARSSAPCGLPSPGRGKKFPASPRRSPRLPRRRRGTHRSRLRRPRPLRPDARDRCRPLLSIFTQLGRRLVRRSRGLILNRDQRRAVTDQHREHVGPRAKFFSYAATTALACVSPKSPDVSAITAPPKPPPVSRAPHTEGVATK